MSPEYENIYQSPALPRPPSPPPWWCARPGDEEREQAIAACVHLRDQLCRSLEELDAEGSARRPRRFQPQKWDRCITSQEGGGGVMALLRGGRVFEKAGVNTSVVWGRFTAEFAQEIPGTQDDPSFFACGVSLVVHPRSPFVPGVHLNCRYIVTQKAWFGGGIDLNPAFPDEKDTDDFHQELKKACDRFDPDFYPRFRDAAAAYFMIPHRVCPRGQGGIFFDHLTQPSFARNLAFIRSLGAAFIAVYPRLVRRQRCKPWSSADRRAQLRYRGLYAEFNLLYDRGTRFGLMTGGHPGAVLMSLPPLASWP